MKQDVPIVATKLSILISLCLFNGCSNADNDETPPHFSGKSGEVSRGTMKTAILLESNTSTTKTIQEAMTLALNGKKVTLHKDAFTQSPHHHLQKKTFIQPHHADGLMLAPPNINRFSLYTLDNRCFLTHNNSANKIQLNNIECQAF